LELVASHKVFYNTEAPVPLSQIAESLLALERVIQRSPNVLEKIFDGIKIDKVYVYVDHIESGSLLETFVVKFIFGSQDKLDDFMLKMRAKTGMDRLNESQIFSAVIMALVLSGALAAYSYWGGPKENQTTIEANNNVIINIGAGMVEMKPEEFRAIVESAVGSRAELAKDAVKIIRPAKADKNAEIVFDDNPDLSIKPETIRAVPSYLQDDISDETISDYENVDIVIRAIDLDSFKRGWAVVIPEIHQKRMPLQLDRAIDPELLMGKREIKGDVTVVFVKDPQGKEIPQKVYLRKLYPENPGDGNNKTQALGDKRRRFTFD
jgi:hypothetical protein